MVDEFISFTDDFMFCSVMEDKKKCKELLQRVLNIEISKIRTICRQKSIKNRAISKGIRLDVYVTDTEGNQYDIEMQTITEPALGKRTRYYHSEMDGYSLKKGAKYSNLKKSIVIFVCTYDCFGDNRSVYTFKNICVENKNIYLNDGIETIILNAGGDRDNVDEKLCSFLDYVKTGAANDDFTKALDESVVSLNNDDDWRDKHMTLQMKMDEKYDAGMKAGVTKTLINLVKSQTITIEQAAKEAGISETEFEKLMIAEIK